ncbi:unnamed protein product [Schistosoma turkestanicum]|nr:unnamed protein product [Schistosoma turkestanicum]
MFKRLVRCHVKSSRTPPSKDSTNNKIHLPTKCSAWLFSTISSSSKISTTDDNDTNKSTEICSVDHSFKTNNSQETYTVTNAQYPNDDIQRISCHPYCPNPESIKLPFVQFTKVRNHFLAIRSQPISSSIKDQLKSYSFNNWLYSDAELINFVKFMFMDLNLPELCRFTIDTLENWLFSIYSRYNNVPFHNFKHAFMVTQMMYCIINMVNLPLYVSSVDLLILLFSALSHDLDHPGFTNSYQINAGTWLALRYNDISPLENHHCMTAFDLITNNPTTNIISGLTPDESRHFRRSVIRCILSTDMAIHSECLSQFQVVRKQVYSNCQSLYMMSNMNNHSIIQHHQQQQQYHQQTMEHSYCSNDNSNSNNNNSNDQKELNTLDPIFPSLQLLSSSSASASASSSPMQQQPTLETNSSSSPDHHHHQYHQWNHNNNNHKIETTRQHLSETHKHYHRLCNNNHMNHDADNDSDQNNHNDDDGNDPTNYAHIHPSYIHSALISLINQQPEYLLRLLMILLKVCDISNEIRPPLIANVWVDCLFNEFSLQATAEKQAGLPVAPYMDPDLVVISNSQLNFLDNILIPLVKELTLVFRELNILLESVNRRLEHFSQIRQYELAQQQQQQQMNDNCCSTLKAISSSPSSPPSSSLSTTTTTVTNTPVCSVMKSSVRAATEENIKYTPQSTCCSDEITLHPIENRQQPPPQQQQPQLSNQHESSTNPTNPDYYLPSATSPAPPSSSSSSSTLCCCKSSSPVKCQQSQVPLYVTVKSPCLKKS